LEKGGEAEKSPFFKGGFREIFFFHGVAGDESSEMEFGRRVHGPVLPESRRMKTGFSTGLPNSAYRPYKGGPSTTEAVVDGPGSGRLPFAVRPGASSAMNRLTR